jgi:adenosylmethionine-8-amino-7-oxononanoate aminotransferase
MTSQRTTTALLHPFARPAARPSDFLALVRGEGAQVVDAAGNRYVDAMASLWHCNVGHARREVAEAISRQVLELETFHCFEKFTNPRAEELADRLALLAPVPASRVFFTSGGSEAVDTALKLSRLCHARRGEPERTMAISRTPSYHGVNYGGTALTGLPLNQAGFGPGVADVVQVGKDDVAAVRAAFQQHPGRIAAVFAEPVIGAGGLWPPAPGYLEALRTLCDEHGAHLVLDEVITGFGRLGSWFGGQHFGVRADLTTFAKGITSGYVPLGGVLVAPSVHEPLSADPDFVLRHGYTYSGHATACAAALACLDITEQEDLLAAAARIGERLQPALTELLDEGRLADVRGAGGMWGVAVPAGQEPAAVRDRMIELGVIVRPIAPDTLVMCPPLVISDGELDQVVDALRKALG